MLIFSLYNSWIIPFVIWGLGFIWFWTVPIKNQNFILSEGDPKCSPIKLKVKVIMSVEKAVLYAPDIILVLIYGRRIYFFNGCLPRHFSALFIPIKLLQCKLCLWLQSSRTEGFPDPLLSDPAGRDLKYHNSFWEKDKILYYPDINIQSIICKKKHIAYIGSNWWS